MRVGDAVVGFTPVGHLLGANALSLRAAGRTLVLSGDLGRDDDGAARRQRAAAVVRRRARAGAAAGAAPNPRNAIVCPGFQVSGTRGANLIGGAREVKIHGEYFAVKCEVSHLEGFSGHADADGLMHWLRGFEAPPERTFVVHGEPAAADALRLRIKDELGWQVAVSEHGATLEA